MFTVDFSSGLAGFQTQPEMRFGVTSSSDPAASFKGAGAVDASAGALEISATGADGFVPLSATAAFAAGGAGAGAAGILLGAFFSFRFSAVKAVTSHPFAGSCDRGGLHSKA